MRGLKTPALAILCALVAGVAFNVQAQTTPRPRQMVSAPYSFKGKQVTTGLVPGSAETYFVTYSGQADNQLNSRSRTTLTFTIQYTASGNSGFVIGGQWTLTQSNRDAQPFTTGGAITPGVLLALKGDHTVGPSTLTLNFEAGDAQWPVSAFFTGTVDRSRPPKLEGNFILTYPVVL